MPKPKGKGGNKRRKGKTNNPQFKRELLFKEDSQEYAQVLRMLGNGRLEAYCFDGVKRLCHIRGQMRKRIWISRDDIILVSIRDFQDSKGDVIHKYNSDEARLLKSYGELPETANLVDNRNGNEDDDSPFKFVDAGEDEVLPSDSDEDEPGLAARTLPSSDDEESSEVEIDDL